MRRSLKIILLMTVVVSAVAQGAAAREVRFEASLDNGRIALGERAQLGLTFYGTQGMPAPDIANIDGLEVRYMGPSTMMTVINGRASSSITHMYTVLPLRTGKFQLGPFSFKYKSDEYVSNMAVLEVTEEAPAQTTKPVEEEADKLGLGERIFLTMEAAKGRAYVNELIPVTVKLYVNRLNVRDIQLPTFGQEGFSKAEFKEPKQYREEAGGIIYDVLEFKTSIFATRPGDYKLGPAQIKCNVIVKKSSRRAPSSRLDEALDDARFDDEFFDNFFTNFERYPMEVKSKEASLVISPLPSEGRPSDFSGAVGDFQFIFNASPKKVKAGDPITLTMEVNGTGNFNTVLMPRLENTEGFKAYEPQVKTEPNTKTFTQILIPENERITQTPKAVFNYFDTDENRYKTISQGPNPIQVEKGKEEAPAQVVGPIAQVPSTPGEERLTRDLIYIKEALGRTERPGFKLYHEKYFLAAIAAGVLFLIPFYILTRRSERLKRDSAYAGRLAALKILKNAFPSLKRQIRSGGDPKVFYEKVFKTLQDYLGNRLNIPPAGITYDAVDGILRPGNINPDILRKLRNLFDVCDRARFADLKTEDYVMMDHAKELQEVLHCLERIRL